MTNISNITDVEPYCYLCVYHDLSTDLYGLNIVTEKGTFGFLMDKAYYTLTPASGSLNNEKIKALRDFLTDRLEGKA